MNTCLCIHKHFTHNHLRQLLRRTNQQSRISFRYLTTRLGTAQRGPIACSAQPSFRRAGQWLTTRFVKALFVVLCCLIALASARAQEDVAETKANSAIDATPIVEPAITAADREHWSFAPIQRPQLPAIQNSKFKIQNPIDLFILAKLEAKNLALSPAADRPTLLRRLHFDLTGLPPSPEELEPFLSPSPHPPLAHSVEPDGDRPDWYERVVDRLLASPAFGERLGQSWLDLARFAESDGYEFDTVRPHAWKYRDWVIAALNADLPYDEFVRLQLAGDEAEGSGFRVQGFVVAEPAEPNPKSKVQNPKSGKPTAPPPALDQIPTTFCLAGSDMPDVNDQLERRHVLLNELTSTVGAVFLGLQLGCAQCHNHKYDPISQADFYRLRAVFEPAVATLKRDMPYNVLANQPAPAPARFWLRGDHRRPGLEVPPAFPRIASTPLPLGEGGRRPGEGVSDSAAGATAGLSLSAAPRSALASWLIRPSNPLTSRVIANRLWQHHFGRGLCATPSDFGVMGGPVTHPELLDWLALELRENGWNMKRLHRLILSSATYRQQSILDFELPILNSNTEDAPADNPKSKVQNLKSADPDNDLFSRFPRQRLAGEAIRDALLAAAGLLTSERGGPGVMPPLPEELLGTLLKGQWSTSQRAADHYKRSIYVFARRNLRLPLFEAFDRPDANATCPLRNQSTTAPQSLLLFNSELSLLAAQHLAGRILLQDAAQVQNTRNQTEQIEQLYLIALSRRPTAHEIATLEKFLASQRDRLAAESRPRAALALPPQLPAAADPHAAAALVDACLAILNSNEFIYVD